MNNPDIAANYCRNIIASSQIAITAVDNDGKITLFNEGAERLTGYRACEALGMSITEFYVSPDNLARLGQFLDKYGKVEDYETLLRHRDGREIPISISVSVLKDENDVAMGSIGISINVEERNRAHRELRKKNQDLAALLEASRSMTSSLETQKVVGTMMTLLAQLLDVDHGLLLLHRRERNELYGAAASEGVGGEYRDIVIPLDEPASVAVETFTKMRPIAVADARNDPRTMKKYVHRTGIHSLLCLPLISHGIAIGVVMLGQHGHEREFDHDEVDIAMIFAYQAAVALENARLYSQLRKSAKALEERVEERTLELVRADKTKSEFLTNMSHEFRTPLNSIIGFSEILLAPPEHLTQDEHREFLENIHSSGEHLLQLVNDILDIAKVESGKMELHLEDFSMNQLLESVTRVLKPLVAKKRLTVETRLDEDPLYLNADSGKLKQIIFNLLSNAVKFTPEGGRIALTVKLLKVGDPLPGQIAREFFPGCFLVVSVDDNGIGIQPENQEHIFKVFFQADGSIARKFEGTGLGLALTRQLVELHGGRIWFESVPGEGSTFSFAVPLTVTGLDFTDSETAVVNRFVTWEVGNRPRVLLVEEDPKMAQLLGHYLAYGGYRVTYASHSREIAGKVQELRPIAILVDLLMNREKALDILSQIKSNPMTSPIPTILLSVGENGTNGFSIGATDILPKPLDCQRLLRVLNGYAERLEDSRPLKILAIDDEETVLAIIKGILELEGYLVFTSTDGMKGIDMARHVRPDLILLDLMMPEADGFTILTTLKSDPALRQIPVMILTAKKLTRADHEQFRGHVLGLMHKSSFSKEELLRELHRLETYRAGTPG